MALINGSIFNDLIRGTVENDQIDGLEGDDYLFGDGGDDTLLGAVGNDILDGWTGNDVLAGGAGDDLLMGHDGNDVMDGGSGNDVLYGEADNDYMVGSVGNDFLNGGSGIDTVDYSFLEQAVVLGAAGVVDKGAAGVDQIFLVENIVGAAGYANTIDASTGDGTDVSLSVDLAANSLVVNDIPGIGTQAFTVQNFVNIVGTTQADVIGGDSNGNIIDGGAGDDIIFGADGDDVMIGADGNDAIGGGNGNDLMLGGSGFDFMDGGAGIDTVDYSLLDSAITLEAAGAINKGAAGVDQIFSVETIIGAAGYANSIDGSTGVSDSVSFNVDLSANSLVVNGIPGLESLAFTVENFINVVGTNQADSIIGDVNNNFLNGNGGNDIIFAGEGDDILDGGTGDDELYGELGDDLLLGFTGNDSLLGGAGTDSLFGESGNDFLVGYGGTFDEYDLLNGGSGADAFFLGDLAGAYYQGLGYATLTDFNGAEGDIIVLAGDPGNYSLGVQDFSGTEALDTLIFFNDDLVGVVQDSTSVNPATEFLYV